MIGITDRLKADGAGHFGRQSFLCGTLVSVLIPEILAQQLGNARRLSLVGSGSHENLTTEICGSGLSASEDPAALILHNNAKSLVFLLAGCLRIKEPLETLLLTLNGAEGLCSTLGEFGVELVVVERSRAEVVAVHLDILNELRVSRKFVLGFRV